MAISAISPIVTQPLFFEPLRQPHAAGGLPNPFAGALTDTLNGISGPSAALRGASAQTQLVNSLEQALFNQWVGSLQSASAGTLGNALDGVLAGLGVSAPTSTDSQHLFDANDPQSLLLAARLISLFNTVDLLGGDGGSGPQLGTLLDTLA